MENETPEHKSKEELLDELIQEETPKPKKIGVTLILRIIGFAVILLSFGVLMLWRNGTVSPMYRPVAIIAGICGFVIYFGGRLVEILTPILRKRKSA